MAGDEKLSVCRKKVDGDEGMEREVRGEGKGVVGDEDIMKEY